MAETIKGINIVIGAETKGLQAALADVNKQSRETASELRQVERGLKFNPKDTELLAQKQKLLGDQVAATKDKLDRLRNAQSQVNEQFEKGKISEGQYRAFRREIVETESKLKHYENQLKAVSKEKSNLKRWLGEVGDKVKEFGKKMADAGKDLTKKVTAPIVAMGAAAYKFAADLEDAYGATDQIFKNASGSMREWANSLESYYGIAKTEALSYSNTMGVMLQEIGGLSESEAAKQSQMLVELAGDLTAMFGGTTQSAVQALTGALKGNTSMLDNYGMGVNDAVIKTKALTMGLYDGTGQMDLAAKQAATLALIMEQTSAAQGQAAREADGASGSMRALMTELKNISTTIGEILLPVVTPVVNGIKNLVTRFRELTPEAQKTIVAIAGIAAAVGPVMVAFNAMVINFNPIIAGLAALSAAGFLLWQNWDAVKNGMLGVLDSLAHGFKQTGSAIKVMIVGFVKMILDIINIVAQYIPGLNKSIESVRNKLEDLIETETDQIKVRQEAREATKAQAAELKRMEREAEAARKAQQELEKAQRKQTQTTKEQTKALEEQGDVLKKRTALEEEWSKKLFQETASRMEILKAERDAAIAEAEKLGADTTDIRRYYIKKATDLIREETEKQRKIDEDAAKKIEDKEKKLADAKEAFEQGWTQKYFEMSATRLEILEAEHKAALDKAREFKSSELEIEAYYEQKKRELRNQTFLEYLSTTQDVMGRIGDIFSQAFSNRDQEIENWYQNQKNALEASLTDEEEKEAAIKQLDEERDRRKREAARKQAAYEKASSLFSIAINTARAIIEALPNLFLSSLIGAMGATQAALVAAKPLPALAEGGKAIAPTMALIGEGRHEEAVLPLSQSVFEEIGRGIVANLPKSATGSGNNYHFYIGALIGDERGYKQLARKVFSHEVSERKRLGEVGK